MLMFWWILVDSTLGKCERARAQVHLHVVGFVAFSAHLESQNGVLQRRHSGDSQLEKSNRQMGLTGLLGVGAGSWGALLSTLPSDLILASYSVNAHPQLLHLIRSTLVILIKACHGIPQVNVCQEQ